MTLWKGRTEDMEVSVRAHVIKFDAFVHARQIT